jgi:hypothetical protein
MNKFLYTSLTGILLLMSMQSYCQVNQTNNKNANGQPATEHYAPILFHKEASADLETIRKRIILDLLEPAINTNLVDQLVKTIQKDESWPGINYKDVSRTG